MYGYKTLAALNNALYAAGLGRFAFTEDEWMFGCDSRKAYTMQYVGVEIILARHHEEAKAAAQAKASRPRLTAAHYHF